MNPAYYRRQGALIATVVWLAVIVIWSMDSAPTRQELQDEFDSYQICMQSAHVCRMVHEDYVRYHELKRMLGGPVPE